MPHTPRTVPRTPRCLALCKDRVWSWQLMINASVNSWIVMPYINSFLNSIYVFGIYYFKIHKWHSLFIFVKRYCTFLQLKYELWSQLNFNKFETSLYIRTLYWSMLLYLFAVFLVHMVTMCLNPLTLKMSWVILLTVCHTIYVMLVWRIWNWINQ